MQMHNKLSSGSEKEQVSIDIVYDKKTDSISADLSNAHKTQYHFMRWKIDGNDRDICK